MGRGLGFATKMKLAGIAAETAALRLIGREAAHRHVVERLSTLPGVPAKMSQLLAMKTGNFTTGSQIAPMALEDVSRILQAECPALARDLISLDPQPRIASLSQVFSGSLRDGRRVAVKVQYPKLAEELEAQVEAAFAAMRTYGPAPELSPRLDLFRQHLLESFAAELNYIRESRSQRIFKEKHRQDSGVRIPEVLVEYSTGRILTQEYVPSEALQELRAWSPSARAQVARQLLEMQLNCVFRHRLVHGDLHPGNWGYDRFRRELVLYDFGSVLMLEPAQVGALEKWMLLGSDASPARCFQAYVELGFDAVTLRPLAPLLPQLTSILTEVFHAPHGWTFMNWNLGERMQNVLRGQQWHFRMAGPPWFLGLMRSCQGLFHALRSLDVNLELPALLQEFRPPAPSPSSETRSGPPTMKTESQNLRVEILENGNPVVELQFPCRSAGWIGDLMPQDLRERLEKEGIRFDEISARAVRTNYAPQDLFKHEIKGRTYRIWLE